MQFQKKLDDKIGEMQEFRNLEDYNQKDLDKVISKIKYYVAVLDEINLKEKLTLKRSLTLCLILLKQCKPNVNDKNLVDICVTIISPALQCTEDKDNLLLAIESIGLLSLLDKDLFGNYSIIFYTILAETSEILHKKRHKQGDFLDEGSLKETLIALKSSIDGLIVHGTTE